MDMTTAWQVSSAVIVSLGGGGAIVFGLSNFLGKVWAQRILGDARQQYTQLNLQFQSQLDIARSRLQVELDALSLVNKLRTEQEFSRLAELWKLVATLLCSSE